MRLPSFINCFALALLASCLSARASETDQFLTWDKELADAAPALNAYLNAEAQAFLDKINTRHGVPQKVDIVRGYYLHLFEGLQSSRLRDWLGYSPEIQRYPDRDAQSTWQYQRSSVYRDPAFPWILPMSRTVRLGDVYLGIDKVSHMFGFGRRYYQRYDRLRSARVPAQEAEDRVIMGGIYQESSLVGGFVDGVFSLGDLEANYQGFRMARDLVEGANPAFVLNGETWSLARPIDILPYITPHMDESWNLPVFTRLRKRQVPAIIRETYCGHIDKPLVAARFAHYDTYIPSRSQELIQQHFAGKRANTLEAQRLEVICAPSKLAACVAQN